MHQTFKHIRYCDDKKEEHHLKNLWKCIERMRMLLSFLMLHRKTSLSVLNADLFYCNAKRSKYQKPKEIAFLSFFLKSEDYIDQTHLSNNLKVSRNSMMKKGKRK
jgi:hypothetical protein